MSDDGELFPEPAKKKHNAQPEHALGVQIHKLARAYITAPHVFVAHDRSKRVGRWQHARESSRGIIAGILDTELMVKGFPGIWAELKVHPNKPEPPQLEMIRRLHEVERIAFVAYTVTEWLDQVMALGVPFMPGAKVAAMRMDGLLDSARLKTKLAKKASKPARKPRPAADRAGLNVAARARKAGIFI